MSQKIIWVGWFWEHSGYALMNRSYVKKLSDRGWDLGIEPIPCPKEITEEEFDYFQKKAKTSNNNGIIRNEYFLEKDLIKILGWIPLKGIPQYKHNIIYTMSESKNIAPNFIETCNNFYNSCWTTTDYYKQIMEDDGMKIPVSVMPIGIDEIYKKENAKKDFKTKYKVFSKRDNVSQEPSGFKFLSVLIIVKTIYINIINS